MRTRAKARRFDDTQAMAVIDGHHVRCSVGGVLGVYVEGKCITVLRRGTHAALDVLGPETKRNVVAWWKEVS